MRAELPDGRVAQYWVGGDQRPEAPTVVFWHGCPDTRWAAMTGDAAARAAGVRLVCLNRPGYGHSTAVPSTHTTVAADAVAVLGWLGIDRFAALGMSVGGPYAAACAARYPDRVTALGLVSSPAPPVHEDRFDDETVEEAVARFRPDFLTWVARIDPDDPDDEALADRFLAELPEADAALMAGLGASFVARSVREALAQHDGFLLDAALTFRDWDFDVRDVAGPVSVWCGAEDSGALTAVERWQALLPEARVDVRAATTHLAALLEQWPAILGGLGQTGTSSTAPTA